jgi:thiosulfate/3-mercaptopyruvate sulfurtransferase
VALPAEALSLTISSIDLKGDKEMTIPRNSRASHPKICLSLVLGAIAFLFTGSLPVFASEMPAIVSPDWLLQNLGDSQMVILDIRAPEQFKKGHIPGSVDVPLSLWAVSNNGLTLELPSDDALRNLVGKSGITPASHVVVVNRLDTDFSRADPARVAWTLHVAGVDNVAILDGGYNRWLREKKATSTDEGSARSGTFAGKIDRKSLATKADVLRNLNKSIIVDAREPEDYFGISPQSGHIRNAVDLPTPWMFESDGTFRKKGDLEAMAAGVLGSNKGRETILYCGVGGYAAAWWFVLTRVLGYRNVEVYDGSMEEWAKDPADPIRSFTWH